MATNTAFYIAAQTDVVPVAWGEPGTGKTRNIEAFGEACGRQVVSISLAQHEPTDIGGYPKPLEKAVTFLKPDWLMKCKDKPSLLFLDELTTCSPATQAAALRLLTHAKEELGDTWVLAAANPPGCAANGYSLEPPVINRLYHHEWENDMDEWTQKVLQGFPKESSADYPILPSNWQEYLPKSRGIILAYLSQLKGDVQHMPKNNTQEQFGPGAAWPSYRSWTNAMTLLAAAMSLGMDSEKDNHPVCTKLLRGTVGECCHRFLDWKTSLGFISWAETKKLIEKDKFTKSKLPNTSDKCMAYLATMFAEATQPKYINEENLDAAWMLLYHATQFGHKDIAISLKDILYTPTKTYIEKKNYDIPKLPKGVMVQIFDRIQGLK